MPEPLRIWWNKNLAHKISPMKLAAHAAHAALAAYGITYDHPIVVLAAGRGKIEAMPIVVHDAGFTELPPGTTTTGVDDPVYDGSWLRKQLEDAWDAGATAGFENAGLPTPQWQENPYSE